MINPRSIHVIRPGLLTTVQDLGRWGFQSQGVPVAGPMDPFSHRLANALVGNPREAAALEITLIGPELEFESDCVAAIGGAEFVVTLGGVAMPHAQAFQVPSRSRMQFVTPTGAFCLGSTGNRRPLVLAVDPRTRQAASADGKATASQGRSVPLGGSRRRRPSSSVHARHDTLTDPAVVRFHWAGRRSSDALDALQSAPYAIAADSDRMGFRLQGANSGTQEVRTSSPTRRRRFRASAGWPAHSADGRSSDDRRLSENCHGDFRRLGIAGQRAPGDTVLFRVCSASDALQRSSHGKARCLPLKRRGHERFCPRLENQFGNERARRDVPLRAYTTFRVGGPAEWFFEPRGSDETVRRSKSRASRASP
jgi:allophanate hydrolase subunit 2